MQAAAATSLLGAHVLLRNGKEGEVVFVSQSPQGFGLQFCLLQEDGTLQESHSADVASLRLKPAGSSQLGGVQACFTPAAPAEPAQRRKPAATP